MSRAVRQLKSTLLSVWVKCVRCLKCLSDDQCSEVWAGLSAGRGFVNPDFVVGKSTRLKASYSSFASSPKKRLVLWICASFRQGGVRILCQQLQGRWGGVVQLWQMWKKMVCIDISPEEAKLHIQVWWSDIHSTALVFVQQSLLIQSLNSTFHPARFFPFEYLPFVTVWNQNFTAERRNINYVCSSTTDTSPSDDIWSQIWTALLHFSRPPYLHNCQKTFTKDAQTQPFRP